MTSSTILVDLEEWALCAGVERESVEESMVISGRRKLCESCRHEAEVNGGGAQRSRASEESKDS